MEPADLRTERDLLLLKGQPESARLEFKSSDLFKKEKPKVIEDLTREVSAFANSEGGVIVIGMRERKEGKTRVADDLDDGVAISEVPPEWLQQTVEANLSPYLPGIRFSAVRLSGAREGRVAYVIGVPKGATAYQAKDKLYYGRSEYQVQALPDHEIRLRMSRPRTAQARLEILRCKLVSSAEQKLKDWKTAATAWRKKQPEWDSLPQHEQVARTLAEAPERPAPVTDFALSLQVRNTGEITLRDFLLSLSFEVFQEGRVVGQLVESEGVLVGRVVGQLFESEGVLVSSDHSCAGTQQRYRFASLVEDQLPEAPAPPKLFPGDTVRFPPKDLPIRVTQGCSLSSTPFKMRWTLYLDDAPPISDVFNLNEELAKVLTAPGQSTV